jgi:hypothetical protein
VTRDDLPDKLLDGVAIAAARKAHTLCDDCERVGCIEHVQHAQLVSGQHLVPRLVLALVVRPEVEQHDGARRVRE